MAIDGMYLENLEEFIFDESKIVTYKWLSKSLAVHVNAAKQMLYTFVDHQRNKKDVDSLNVTYVVCGIKEDDKGNISHHVEILPEESLNAVKSTYKKITSCHVYSVQKAKLKDSNALYIVDYDILKKQIFSSNQFSAITCKTAIPRSRDELSKKQPAVSNKQDEPSNKSTTKQTSAAAKAKSKGLVGMFGRAAEKKKDEPVKETKEKSPEKKKEPDSKGKGKMGASSFFGKSNSSKKSSEPAKESVSEKPKADVKKETETTKGKKNIRPVSDDEDDVQQKKRRRIKAWESSSEEEEEDIEEPESPIPPPPHSPSPTPMEEETEDPLPPTVKSPVKREVIEKSMPSGGGDGKRRRVRKRKLVPKTFMDDKGYMVTEKAWESDSTDASEVEEIAPPKQNKPQEKDAGKKKTASPPKKTKQASLMSFFGKK